MSTPIQVVYAMGTEHVGMPSGDTVPVIKGTHWHASDPVVRARPALFSPDPRYGLAYSQPPPGYDNNLDEIDEDEVEQASAAPGEKRSVRRRREESPADEAVQF